MPTAKEIKICAREKNLSHAEARKFLLAQEAEKAKDPEALTKALVDDGLVDNEGVDTNRQLRLLARREGTIALGLVVEKRGRGKPAKGLPKLDRKSPVFRVDVTLAEIEQLAQAAQRVLPGALIDDFAHILGDGLKQGAHLENGEEFASALCAYFVQTEGYHLLKQHPHNPDFQGAIIRMISYKDGYVIRPADYIRSYEQVDKSFMKMKIQ